MDVSVRVKHTVHDNEMHFGAQMMHLHVRTENQTLIHLRTENNTDLDTMHAIETSDQRVWIVHDVLHTRIVMIVASIIKLDAHPVIMWQYSTQKFGFCFGLRFNHVLACNENV